LLLEVAAALAGVVAAVRAVLELPLGFPLLLVLH
jgi:hypothetical protein